MVGLVGFEDLSLQKGEGLADIGEILAFISLTNFNFRDVDSETFCFKDFCV